MCHVPRAKAAASAAASPFVWPVSFAIEYLFAPAKWAWQAQLKVITRKARKGNPPFANQAKLAEQCDQPRPADRIPKKILRNLTIGLQYFAYQKTKNNKQQQLRAAALIKCS